MQGQRRTIDSYPENVDFDQGSVSNGNSMNQQTWNNMFDPEETRLPNYMQSSGEPNFTCGNAVSQDVRSFSSWGSGEASTSANPLNQAIDDGSKMEHSWSTSFSVHTGAAPRLEERRFESSNVLHHENGHVGSSVNVDRNTGYVGDSGKNGQGMAATVSSNLGKSGGPEPEQIPFAGFSSCNVGPSLISGSILEENDGGSASSLGSWGSSCKRKALEGTSGQSYPGGSSSCFAQAENSVWNTVPARHSASSSLSISTPPRNSRTASATEQLNPRIGVGTGGEAFDDFPPLSVPGNSESSLRNFERRVSSGHHQEPVPFNLSSIGRSRQIHLISPFQMPSSRPPSYSEYLESRSAAANNIGASPSQSNVMHSPGLPRNVHPFPWNGASISRAGSSSSSMNRSGDRGLALREEANLANMSRNSAEHSMSVHANEMRTLAQDPTNWSLATGNINTSGVVVPSTSRVGASSSVHPLTPSWILHPNPQTHNQQRLSGFSPWTLFPSVDSEPGGQSAYFPPLSSGATASSQETIASAGPSSQGYRQPHLRPAVSMERQGDDVLGMPHSLRALAADIEGRHRLISEIRQVLSAMRRGENLRAEDYMLFDPLIFHGLPEIHDRHRDMRLDVDNMSYEELLALGERIGDVKTGLDEDKILKLMKQRKCMYISTRNPKDMEPCCICQEEYKLGDDLGTLECGHDFHTNCIKQWLVLKNLCPICKTTGLIT